MKKLILTAALGVACVSAFAQGTFNFNNAGVGYTAKILDTAGVGLSGGAWDVDLYWGAAGVTDSTTLAALGAPSTFSTVASQAGYFFGGVRTVPNGPPGGGTITGQLRVWEASAGSTWTQAAGTPGAQIGSSVLFQITLANPNASPPGTPVGPGNINGHGFSLTLVPSGPPSPEPSTLALAGLGLAGMLMLRRRK